MHRLQIVACCLLLAGAAAAQQAKAPAGAGCVLERQDHYLCNRAAFQARLARARTVRVDAEHLDLFATEQLTRTVEAMSKEVALPGQRPDLVFSLLPVDRSGRIDYGPSDFPVAVFSVSDPAMGSGPRSLLWTETFDGQGNRPWPGIVVELLHRFQDDAQRR